MMVSLLLLLWQLRSSAVLRPLLPPVCGDSGVHRLFEGHLCFANQEGSLSCFNQPRGQFSVF